MSGGRNSNTDPHIPLDLLIYVKYKDLNIWGFVVTHNFLVWKTGHDLQPAEDIALQMGISERQVHRIVKILKAEKLYKVVRTAKGNAYQKTIPIISFKEAFGWGDQPAKLAEGPPTDRPNCPDPSAKLAYPNIKDLKESEKESGVALADTPGLSFKQAIAIYKRLWSGNYQGEAYGTTKADPGAFNAFIKANPEVGPELFEAKAQGFLIQGDAWIKARRHPMLYLCSQWNSWRPVTLSPEKPRVNL